MQRAKVLPVSSSDSYLQLIFGHVSKLRGQERAEQWEGHRLVICSTPSARLTASETSATLRCRGSCLIGNLAKHQQRSSRH